LIIKVYRKKNYVVTIQPDIRYPAKKIGRISGNSVSGATLNNTFYYTQLRKITKIFCDSNIGKVTYKLDSGKK